MATESGLAPTGKDTAAGPKSSKPPAGDAKTQTVRRLTQASRADRATFRGEAEGDDTHCTDQRRTMPSDEQEPALISQDASTASLHHLSLRWPPGNRPSFAPFYARRL